MANDSIREAIKEAGVKYWEVADAYGVCDTNFSRLLRKELSGEKRERVFKAIEKVRVSKEG